MSRPWLFEGGRSSHCRRTPGSATPATVIRRKINSLRMQRLVFDRGAGNRFERKGQNNSVAK